jgi:hypothetical protein
VQVVEKMERETGVEPATSSLGIQTYVGSKSLARLCCEFLNLQRLAESAFSESPAQLRHKQDTCFGVTRRPNGNRDGPGNRACMSKRCEQFEEAFQRGLVHRGQSGSSGQVAWEAARQGSWGDPGTCRRNRCN